MNVCNHCQMFDISDNLDNLKGRLYLCIPVEKIDYNCEGTGKS